MKFLTKQEMECHVFAMVCQLSLQINKQINNQLNFQKKQLQCLSHKQDISDAIKEKAITL